MIKEFRLYWSDLTAEKQQEIVAEVAELILEDWRKEGMVPKNKAKKRELALTLAEDACRKDVRGILIQIFIYKNKI